MADFLTRQCAIGECGDTAPAVIQPDALKHMGRHAGETADGGRGTRGLPRKDRAIPNLNRGVARPHRPGRGMDLLKKDRVRGGKNRRHRARVRWSSARTGVQQERLHASSASTSTRRRWTKLNKGESYIKHIPSSLIEGLIKGGRFQATTDYARLVRDGLRHHLRSDAARQDAAAGPLLRRQQRQEHRGDASQGAAGGPRKHDLPRHDRRGRQADPRGERAQVRQGLLSRVFARARGPGEPQVQHRQHPQGRRRRRRDERQARRGALRQDSVAPSCRSRQRARRRGDQDPREHLPLHQYRARQRAQGALRQDGHRYLGSHRRGQDQAVRLPGVLSRPRPRRALHPDRPVLPLVEGQGSTRCPRGLSSWPAR